jgi:hypothetical protein
MKTRAHLIKVIATPDGEAPLWVRQKWIGVELPLAQSGSAPITVLGSGVLSGPRNLLARFAHLFMGRYHRQRGYKVSVQAAVEALARVSPEAANWWMENTPHLQRPGRFFLFQHEACLVMSDTPVE